MRKKQATSRVPAAWQRAHGRFASRRADSLP
jgi:hypothetical protein